MLAAILTPLGVSWPTPSGGVPLCTLLLEHPSLTGGSCMAMQGFPCHGFQVLQVPMFHYGKALHDSATKQSITFSPGLFQTPSLVAVELVPPGNGL